jgi:gluconate 5-dehydrogenase
MSLTLFDLSGKRALITGSSQGIGFALARGLAAAGAEVVLNGRDSAKLAETAAALRAKGARVHELGFDVTDHHGVRAAVDGFEAEHGAIDILVNNAGMQHRAPLEEFPPEAFERLLQTNIASVFHVGQAVARHMIARGAGKIVNIAKHGLQCNALAPGYFVTPLNKALLEDPAFNDWLAKRTPAGRWGQVEELVGACIFLASAASSFVNGTTIFVDGGITASL